MINKHCACLKRCGTFIMVLLLKFFAGLLNITLRKLLWCITVLSVIFIWHWTGDCDVGLVSDYHIDSYPTIFWWTLSFPGTSETRTCPGNIKCNIISANSSDFQNVEAYLFYASTINFDYLPLPRRPADIIWGVYHEESPRNVEELMHEEALNLFNFSSTFSRYSDVPFPLQYLGTLDDITNTKYFVPTAEKNRLLVNEIAPVLYLQSDCETTSERDQYTSELMKYIRIDSYGSCLRNKDMPLEFANDYLNRLDDDDFLKFVSRYKFVLAIENGVCQDYVTEKFWRAIKVGSVPIYFGSPTIRDWLPNPESAILLEDHPTPKVMSAYLKKLLQDDYSYERHLLHKTQGIISNTKLITELKTNYYALDPLQTAIKFECHVCEVIYKKRLGLAVENIVTRSHYNCPEPISALSLKVNPRNPWVDSYRSSKQKAKDIFDRVFD